MTVVFKSRQATVIMTFPQLPKCITLDLQTLLFQPFSFNRCHEYFCGLPPFKLSPCGSGSFALNRQAWNRSSGCYSRPFISHLIIIRIALPDFHSVAQDHYLRWSNSSLSAFQLPVSSSMLLWIAPFQTFPLRFRLLRIQSTSFQS